MSEDLAELIGSTKSPEMANHEASTVELVVVRTAIKFWHLLNFRGLTYASEMFNRLFPSHYNSTMAKVYVADDTQFSFRLYDFFWNRLLADPFLHEPEVRAAISLLACQAKLFIDAGANYGYWALVASSNQNGALRAIAIEPSSENFQALQRNNKLNRGNIECIMKAIGADIGEAVLYGTRTRHGSFSINIDPLDDSVIDTVKTTTLKSVIETYASSIDGIICKLDIEGQEVEALSSLSSSDLERMAIIYEEHSKDLHCGVSAYVIDDMGLSCLRFDGQRWTKMESHSAVVETKARTRRGMNLVAFLPGSRFEGCFKPIGSAARA